MSAKLFHYLHTLQSLSNHSDNLLFSTQLVFICISPFIQAIFKPSSLPDEILSNLQSLPNEPSSLCIIILYFQKP